MDRILARLERRFGQFAIRNLIAYVVGGMALFWVLSLARPEVAGRLVLDMSAVRRGQAWRLFTFLLVPPQSGPIWVLVNLYFTWWIGSSLEQRLGPFRFNVYYFTGALATIVAAIVAGPMSNTWLDWSLFLAFATLFPNVSILLFFVIPVRIKWLGIAVAAWFLFELVTGSWGTRAAVLSALANYSLFFVGHWFDAGKQRSVASTQKARREQYRSTAHATGVSFGQRVCAICGAREADGADIRVCACEKCGRQQRSLCLEHARAH